MSEDPRPYAIRSLIADYVKSPSLKHIRDPYFIAKLAKDILREVDRKPPPWSKWDSLRETHLTAAAATWIPLEDLRKYLNELPGQQLSLTDVSQRLRAIQEDGFDLYPDARLEEACLSRYKHEIGIGTEMTAIIGDLQEFVENKRERMRIERLRNLEEIRASEKEAAQQRLVSGADCKWTPLENTNQLACRTNGRLYKLRRRKDQKWDLLRIDTLIDGTGVILGTYGGRREATKAVSQIAFQPEQHYRP